MMKIRFAVLAIFLGAGLGLSCGKGQGAPVSGTASFYNGPTPVGHLLGASKKRASPKAGPRFVQDGNWLLSPNKMILTVTSIQLQGDPMDPVSVNCQLTYDLSQPGLTKLSDCPITIPSGTYNSIAVGLAPTYQVLLNDTVSGFYTTSSGIQITSPAGGPTYFTVNTSNTTIYSTFAAPITISSSSTPTLSIVIQGLQFFRAQTASNAVTLGWSNANDGLDPHSPDMMASLDSLASVSFYSNTALVGTGATVGAICTGGLCSGPPYQGIIGLYVFYTAANAPSWLQMVPNGTQNNCPPIGPDGAFNNHQGYLGLDGTNTLGWAVPVDQNYTTWASEFSMPQQTMIGQSSTLKCLTITSDPAPAGGTFASGAPAIGGATYSSTMKLMAN